MVFSRFTAALALWGSPVGCELVVPGLLCTVCGPAGPGSLQLLMDSVEPGWT